MPDVESIFEIGGHDSKYIRLKGDVIVDFEMNKTRTAGPRCVPRKAGGAAQDGHHRSRGGIQGGGVARSGLDLHGLLRIGRGQPSAEQQAYRRLERKDLLGERQ
jgi:hypothetical protein